MIQIGAFDYADSNRGKLAYNLADHANLLNYYSDDIFMASSGGALPIMRQKIIQKLKNTILKKFIRNWGNTTSFAKSSSQI